MLSNLIELTNINKYYKLKDAKLHVLKDINLTIEQGDFVMIMGKSGSGKTTLLNLLGFLDHFDNGKYEFNGKDVTHLSENERSELRNSYLGFIFQQFHLIDSLSIGQNVELPLLYKEGTDIPKKERARRVEKYLETVGLLHKEKQSPSQLSGGQQQRIAIARALINNPYLILADEPTGALDSKTREEIMNILKKLNEENKTIIMVTHDDDLTKYASKVIHLKDGEITKVD
ncbi:ABC transporter ATP-binding protein [Clostridium estertheticum]|uniref:ABC transporter ATP-binding protein n=1 Tax=Clostridium estertheticum TaxID=238834 RepID=UPI001C6E0649|nr:ABC transporter ATP-binding protein [Clostridium estertheticum]MBW9152415.1 ABC transporter ATP-binding protein [Clostridium estertheticum]WLC86317.1 ABC transporter ATP-binding protein [Clostridium estertheticum]